MKIVNLFFTLMLVGNASLIASESKETKEIQEIFLKGELLLQLNGTKRFKNLTSDEKEHCRKLYDIDFNDLDIFIEATASGVSLTDSYWKVKTEDEKLPSELDNFRLHYVPASLLFNSSGEPFLKNENPYFKQYIFIDLKVNNYILRLYFSDVRWIKIGIILSLNQIESYLEVLEKLDKDDPITKLLKCYC